MMATAEQPKLTQSQTISIAKPNTNKTDLTPKHFPEVESYNIKNPYVIMIGIHDYGGDGVNLEGVPTDIKKMSHLWKDCYNYTINVQHDISKDENEVTVPKMRWTSTEIETFLERCRGEVATNAHDALILMLSCHGEENSKWQDCATDSENNLYPLQNLFDMFSGRQCYWLRDKPKIFILDCCRGRSPAKPLMTSSNNTGIDNNDHKKDENDDNDEKKNDIDDDNGNINTDSNSNNVNSTNVKTNNTDNSKRKPLLVSNDNHFVYIYATTHGNAALDGGAQRGGYLLDAVNTICKEVNWVEINNITKVIEYIKRETEQNANQNHSMMVPEFKKTGTMFIYLRKNNNSDKLNSLHHSNIGWLCSICYFVSSPQALRCEHCNTERPSDDGTETLTSDSSSTFAVTSALEQTSSEITSLKTLQKRASVDPEFQEITSLDDDDIKKQEIARVQEQFEKQMEMMQKRFDNLQSQLEQMKRTYISAKGNTKGLNFVQNKQASHYNVDFRANMGKIELLSSGFIRQFIDINNNNNSDIINPIMNYIGISFNAMTCIINVVKQKHSGFSFYSNADYIYQQKLFLSKPLNDDEEIYLKLVESNCIKEDWWKNNGYEFGFGLIGINNKCITNYNYCTLDRFLEIFENSDLSKYESTEMIINPLLDILSDNSINSDAICIYGLKLYHRDEKYACNATLNVSERPMLQPLDNTQHNGLTMRINKVNNQSTLTFWNDDDKLIGENYSARHDEFEFGRFYLKPNYHYIPYFQSSTCDCNENGFKFEITKRKKSLKSLPDVTISQKIYSGYKALRCGLWVISNVVVNGPFWMLNHK